MYSDNNKSQGSVATHLRCDGLASLQNSYHSVDDVCNNVNIIIVINQMKNCKMVLKLYKTKLQITLGCYGLALSDTGSLYNTQATRDGAIFTCWSNRLDGVSTSYLEQCKEYLLV